MLPAAPRRAVRGLRCLARGAVLAFALVAPPHMARACGGQDPSGGTAMPGSLVANPAQQPDAGPYAAWFETPTTRYAHGVLGDSIEAGALVVLLTPPPDCRLARVDLPQDRVFEDLAPRLHDLDHDGHPEIVTVESSAAAGARLAVYGRSADGHGLELRAATPHIGRANRWLAPAGVADFNGDGLVDIAYVDRPHLARVLRIWTFDGGGLREIASAPGFSNHRIGEDFITGGVRDCGDALELILPNADWTQVMQVRLSEAGLEARAVADFSMQAVVDALDCGHSPHFRLISTLFKM